MLLTWFGAVMPIWHFKRECANKEFRNRYRAFKLYSIKHYHPAFKLNPALARLSYEEIASRYNVDRAYEEIG